MRGKLISMVVARHCRSRLDMNKEVNATFGYGTLMNIPLEHKCRSLELAVSLSFVRVPFCIVTIKGK